MGIQSILAARKPKLFDEWQKLRKKNPRLYYNSAVQNKVASDIEALGSDVFFGKKPRPVETDSTPNPLDGNIFDKGATDES